MSGLRRPSAGRGTRRAPANRLISPLALASDRHNTRNVVAFRMEDFIEGFGITQNKLAVSIGVLPRRINEIVYGKRRITADTAIRLARYFRRFAEFWMNLQSTYELRIERRVLQGKIALIKPLAVA